MGKKSIAKKVAWGICPLGQILFERHKDCWRIVMDFQIVPECVTSRRVLEIIPINYESLGFVRMHSFL